MADVTMPQLGETVTEGTITRWFKQVGDHVEMDEILFEVSTDKVDSEVPSPIAGTLLEIFANEGDLVEVGQVLAQIGEASEASAAPAAAPAESDVLAAPAPDPDSDVLAAPAPDPDSDVFAAPAPDPQPDVFAAPAPDPQPVPVIEPAPAPESPLPEPEPAQVSADPTPGPVSESPLPEPAPTLSETAPPSSTLPPPPLPPKAAAAVSSDSTASPEAAAGLPKRGVSSALLSPVVRRLIADNGLDPSTIVGTGIGGRITRADVEAAIRSRASAAPSTPSVPSVPSVPSTPSTASTPSAQEPVPPPPFAERPSEPAAAVADTPPVAPAIPSPEVGTRDKVVALNNIRKRTAEHMVMSKSASPHVLTAMEIDYEGVEKVRKAVKSGWKAEEGFSLTYLPFIARAVVDALREYPHLNASFGGDHLVVHDEVNLAIAVDIDFNGLLAPVLKGTEGKRLRQIARDIVDVAARARTKQLMPDELSGGTFTLTNAGQYGTMMQFPIINQPQVAILSTDGVARKPVVVTDSFGNESIAIHSMGVLAMAWDHRAFDGAYAAAFLHRVKEIIETRDWEAEVR